MVRPKVDSRLQNIEQGIKNIQEKLCKIHPCETKQDDVATTEES
jgi:hypothetical protein